MRESEQIPQLVLNQYSNRYFNMQPFFRYLNERRHNDPKAVVKRIDWTIRFVSLNFDEKTEALELKNALDFLFEMKDVFDNMAEFKSNEMV